MAVVGKGRRCPPHVYELGLEVGGVIGDLRDKATLLTGGLGGVMEAAAAACSKKGGFVVSLLPGAADRTSAPGTQVDVRIDTGLPASVRNVVMGSACDLMVALPGSHGTVQEAAVAADLGKPVWGIGDHGVRLPFVSYLEDVATLRRDLAAFLDSHGAAS